MTREEFMRLCGRAAGLLVLGGATGALAAKTMIRKARGGTVWQIDPNKCTQCGQCATHCVLDQSAVKCFHHYPMCGYCELCSGFFELQHNALTEAAENQLCPNGALKRRFVEEPYFQYTIDEDRCVGCGRCVEGCTKYGNGSLYLQVRHDICVNCNVCNIGANCPSNAFVRVPASDPYIPRLGRSS